MHHNEQIIKIGDKVRFTTKYLRSTGQLTGPESLSHWIVTAIERDWVVTNQPTDTSWYTAEEIVAQPSLAFRRINLGNLEKLQ